MAEIICDTSAMQYLHQLGRLHLLRDFYQKVAIPPAVVEELSEGRSQRIELPDPAELPWVLIRRPRHTAPAAAGLGSGEAQVLALAMENPETLVLLDDARARRVAEEKGLPMIGTLGVLLKAKSAGFVPAVAPLLDRLEALRFRLAPRTRAAVLKLAGE